MRPVTDIFTVLRSIFKMIFGSANTGPGHHLVVLFSLLMYIIITIYGRVKKSVMPLFIFWIIFLLDLELNFIDKLLVFRWELIVLLLLQICFFFVMREIS